MTTPTPHPRRRRSSAVAVAAIATPLTVLAIAAGGLSAGATAASSPSLKISQTSGLSAGQTIKITGKGFSKSSLGTVAETNNTATSIGTPDTGPQPLTQLYLLGVAKRQIPVSTYIPWNGTVPVIVATSKSGSVSTTFTLKTGTIGDIPYFAGGTSSGIAALDSTDADSHTDAAAYPIPPLAGQLDHNGNQATALLTYSDSAGDQVQVPLFFGNLVISSSSGLTLPDAARGAAYVGTTLHASNGIAPFAFKATGLPKGLKLSKAGVLSGTPAAKDRAGTYSVTIAASDAKPGKATGSATYTLVVI